MTMIMMIDGVAHLAGGLVAVGQKVRVKAEAKAVNQHQVLSVEKKQRQKPV
jgi:hypothetical protein